MNSFSLSSALRQGDQGDTRLTPQLPIFTMSGAPWNILDASGKRIACFKFADTIEAEREGVRMATDAVKTFQNIAAVIEIPGQQVDFQDMVIYELLNGQFKQSQAEHWAQDPELPRFAACVQAIKEHLRCEEGEILFNLFATEDEAE